MECIGKFLWDLESTITILKLIYTLNVFHFGIKYFYSLDTHFLCIIQHCNIHVLQSNEHYNTCNIQTGICLIIVTYIKIIYSMLLFYSLSWVQLFATPWTIAHQAPLSLGFSRQEYCSGLPFPPPGDLPGLGIETASPSLAGRCFTTEPPGASTYINFSFFTNQWFRIDEYIFLFLEWGNLRLQRVNDLWKFTLTPPPTNFIVETGQRWPQAIISMLRVGKLRPERWNALLEVTELQVDRRIWTQVSLTPEPRGSSSTVCLVLLKPGGEGLQEQEEMSVHVWCWGCGCPGQTGHSESERRWREEQESQRGRANPWQEAPLPVGPGSGQEAAACRVYAGDWVHGQAGGGF